MIIINISKAEKSLSVDWDAMPEAAQRHIIEYGLRQKLNDAGSQFKKGEENFADNAFGAAETVLAALMAGQVTVRQSKGSATLEQRFFTKHLRALFTTLKLGKIATETDTSDDTLLAAIAEKTGKDAEVIRAVVQKQADASADAKRKADAEQAAMLADIDITL